MTFFVEESLCGMTLAFQNLHVTDQSPNSRNSNGVNFCDQYVVSTTKGQGPKYQVTKMVRSKNFSFPDFFAL